jgi:VanZ family protein
VAANFSLRARRRLRILWSLAVALVIVGSLLPGTSFAMQSLGHLGIGDKLLHFAAYALLGFLPALHERWPALTASLLGVILLGVLLEFAQRFSAGRSFEPADMVADACGALCGFLLALPLRSQTAPFTASR